MSKYNVMLRVLWNKASKRNGYPIKIRIVVDGGEKFIPTGKFVTNKTQWNDSTKQVIKRPDARFINDILQKKLSEYQHNGIVAELQEKNITFNIIKGKKVKSFYDYARSVRGDTEKTRTILNRTNVYWGSEPRLNDITVEWLREMEIYLREGKVLIGTNSAGPIYKTNVYKKGKKKGQLIKYADNTLENHMKLFRRVLNQAEIEGYIKKSTIGKGQYKVPPPGKTIPIFLVKEERELLLKGMLERKIIDPQIHKTLVYFMLGCYTGLRRSDWYKFDPDQHIQGNMIVLRTTKTDGLVCYPHGVTTKAIVEMIKLVGPLDFSETKIANHLRKIQEFFNIKKKLRPHVSRHSFGVLMPENKINETDCAYYMGITVRMVQIYYHVTGAMRAANTAHLEKI